MEGRGRPSLTMQLGLITTGCVHTAFSSAQAARPQERRARHTLHIPVPWATEGDPSGAWAIPEPGLRPLEVRAVPSADAMALYY